MKQHKYIILGGITILCLIVLGVSYKVFYSNTQKTIDTNKDNVSMSYKAELNYYNLDKAKSFILTSGEHEVGRNFAPGRYKMSLINGNNNSYNLTTDKGYINIILGRNPSDDEVSSYTATLQPNEKINLSGGQSIQLTPITQHHYLTTLSAGRWRVGHGWDIKPGTYKVSDIKGSGLIVFNLNNKFRVNSKTKINDKIKLSSDSIIETTVESVTLKPVK